MNCKLNYLYEKFPDNPEFAQHLEQIELSIWKTFKDEKFPTFEYEGKRYYSISPKMSKERKKQMKILQSLRDKYNSPNLFLTKKLYPFDYDLITIRMGTIVSSQKELFDVLQKNKPKKPPEEKEAYPSIYEETYEKFLRFNSNTSNPQSSENKNINNQQKNVVYSAIFFNTNELTNKYNQVHPNLYSHHSTIEFKPQTIENLPVGENRNIRIIGRLTTDKVDVLIVDNPLSKNKFPHITLSTAEGVKPFESNSEIEKNQNKIKPLNDIIVGKVGYFDGKNEIVNDEKFDENYNLNKIKSGVEELFDSNPELANIGTAELYSQYLDTIFPDSKVKDIVYRGGEGVISKEQYYTLQKQYAERYGKAIPTILNLPNPVIADRGIHRSWVKDELTDRGIIGKDYPGSTSDALIEQMNGDIPFSAKGNFDVYVIKNENQKHTLGSKQDIQGFKSYVQNKQSVTPRQGISELFAENPQLASIGTQEQYERYLSTIFPDSKVKDIVYHSRFNVGNIKNKSRWRNGFYSGTKDQADLMADMAESSNDLMTTSALLINMQNPKVTTYTDRKVEDYENTNDGFIIEATEKDALQLIGDRDGYNIENFKKEYVVFEPEQIHILGNKQDIEGFKKFVNQNQIEDNVFNKYSYIKNIENKINYQKLTEEEKNQTVAEAAKKAGSVNALHDLAARLADRIGGTVKFENIRNVDYKGYNQGNVSVINEAYADTSTVVHEILGHPIINAIRNVSDETEQFFSGKVENVQTLYKNLLKELEYGTGKEVLDRIKRDYIFKEGVNNKLKKIATGHSTPPLYSFTPVLGRSKALYSSPRFKTKEEAIKWYGEQGYSDYTLEEQQEEAIVELLGMYTANKLDAVKDKGLIAILKKLLKEMTAYLRSLFNSKEIEIEKLDVSMTLDDLANLLAYTNSKLLLPNSTIEYTTPDNKKFKTYAEASKHISNLAKSVEAIDLSENISIENIDKQINDLQKELDNFKLEVEPFNKFVDVYTKQGRLRQNYWARRKDGTSWTAGAKETLIEPEYDGFVLDRTRGDGRFITKVTDEEAEKIYYSQENKFNIATKESREKYAELETKLHNLKYNSVKGFIEKNKEYEQSKEIIEEWKKVNNIQYNPEEVYSRGQEFVSVVGAYSDFDVKLMMQNLLSHIEDNEKAGGKFAISVFTKPVDKTIEHLEGGGGKIKFKIFPKSEDILWAANRDVYSGSVWDAGEKVNKDKKSELLGVSYTKYPSLKNVKSVQPNLADIIDDIQWGHNELGISLTGNNFRLEYDKDIPYTTKKIIDSVNSILDQKYGKLVKPEINKNQIGIQPKITNETLKESIDSVQNKLGITKSNTDRKKFLKDEIDSLKTAIIKKTNKDKDPYKEYDRVVIEEEYFAYEKNGEYFVIDMSDSQGEPEIISKDLFESKLKEYGDSKKIKIQDDYYLEVPDKIYFSDSFETEKEARDYIKNTIEEYSKELEILNKEKEYTSQALINTKIAALKEVAKKYPRSLIRSEVVSISEFNEVQYQKLPSQLDKNQSNQIEELKQSDPRWNKYSNEDIQRFIDSVFPNSKVKDVLKHTTKATIIDSFRKGFGRLGEGVYLAGSDYKLYDKAGENKYHVLVNINNPKRYDKGDFVIEANNKFPSENEYSNEPQKNLQNLDKSEGVDAYVSIAGTGTEYNVFEPEQIYILNSEKAIADMEKFVGGKPTFNKELVQNIQKLFESNPELANAVYEALGFEIPTTKLQGKKKDSQGNIITFDVIEELTSNERKDLPESILLKKLFDGKYIPKTKNGDILLGSQYRMGSFSPGSNLIEVKGANKDIVSKILNHELLHAVTYNIIKNYQAYVGERTIESIEKDVKYKKINLTEKQINALNELTKLKNKVITYYKNNSDNIQDKYPDLGKSDYFIRTQYSEADLDEFISEVFSNRNLIEVLKQIPSEGKKSNLFKDFVDAIAKILGFTNTSILEDIVAYSEEAFFAQPQITPQQKQQAILLYSQYLDSVFPDSKVKDIVYHGSKNKLQENKFDLSKARFEKAIFFFKNRINALKWESENPIKIQKKDLKNIINLNKDLNLEDDSIENNIFYTLAGAQNISDLLNLPNSELILEDFNKIGGAELYLEKSLEEIKKILDKHTSGKTNNVINAILNIRNPKKESNLDYIKLSKEGEKIKDIFREASKNNDGVILENITEYTSSKELAEKNFKTKTVTFNANFGIQTDELYSLNTDTQYAVFEPEQIHILGSKQDVEGFQNFVNQNQFQQKQQAQKLYSEYLQQNPNGNVKQFESWVLNSLNKKDNNFEDNVSCFI